MRFVRLDERMQAFEYRAADLDTGRAPYRAPVKEQWRVFRLGPGEGFLDTAVEPVDLAATGQGLFAIIAVFNDRRLRRGFGRHIRPGSRFFRGRLGPVACGQSTCK